MMTVLTYIICIIGTIAYGVYLVNEYSDNPGKDDLVMLTMAIGVAAFLGPIGFVFLAIGHLIFKGNT